MEANSTHDMAVINNSQSINQSINQSVSINWERSFYSQHDRI
jgi:hypothetical protein